MATEKLELVISAEIIAGMLEQIASDIEGRAGICAEIMTERFRQDAQWGGPEHDDQHSAWDWNRFIKYQLDAATNIVLNAKMGDEPISKGTWRGRMIKIAALAIAAIESRDRVMADQPPTTGEES